MAGFAFKSKASWSKAWSGVRVLFCQISYTSIHNVLGGGLKGGAKSVFDVYGFKNEDGSPIKITTHQFRRWLNTLAHLVALKAVLADPNIENGAIIQLSNPTAPSRLKEALASRVRLDAPKTKGVLNHEKENAARVEQIKDDKTSASSKSA